MGELSTTGLGGETPAYRSRCVSCATWFDQPASGVWQWVDRLYWQATVRCEPCARGIAERVEASEPGRMRFSPEEWARPLLREYRETARPVCAGRTPEEARRLLEDGGGREEPRTGLEAPRPAPVATPRRSSRRRRSDVRR